MRLLALALLTVGCASDTVEELVDNNDVEDLDLFEEPGDGVVYDLDVSANPELIFTGYGVGNSEQHGTWLRYDARAVKDGDALTDLDIVVLVEMDSVETGSGQLTSHLKTADFFDVANHPEAEFHAIDVVHVSGDNYRVNGTLTMRGTTKDVSWETVITEENGVIHTTAHIEFSRWDWRLYPESATEAGDGLASDEVLLDYDVTLVLTE